MHRELFNASGTLDEILKAVLIQVSIHRENTIILWSMQK